MLQWLMNTITVDEPVHNTPCTKDYECVLINMDKADDRYTTFLSRFHASDLRMHQLSRYSAVDGTLVDIASMLTPLAYTEVLDGEKNKYRRQHYELTRGAVGCYLSHVGVWNRMLQGTGDCLLVFEDDAWVVPSLGAHVEGLMSHVPTDWDIVLLGYVLTKYRKGTHLHQAYRFYCLHGYLISRKGAEKILRSGYVYPIAKQLDSMLSDLADKGLLNVYAAPRQMVRQDNRRFGTSIQIPLKDQYERLQKVSKPLKAM